MSYLAIRSEHDGTSHRALPLKKWHRRKKIFESSKPDAAFRDQPEPFGCGTRMLVTYPHRGHSYATNPGSSHMGAIVTTSVNGVAHRGHCAGSSRVCRGSPGMSGSLNVALNLTTTSIRVGSYHREVQRQNKCELCVIGGACGTGERSAELNGVNTGRG
jgi:hypothetical protein